MEGLCRAAVLVNTFPVKIHSSVLAERGKKSSRLDPSFFQHFEVRRAERDSSRDSGGGGEGRRDREEAKST